MKVSYKGDYALKAMLELAMNYNNGLVTTNDLAKRINAPLKFLEQVLLELRRGGFIVSRRGNIGGYMLSREPNQISVGEVVRYIDGPIEPIACLDQKYANCLDMNTCVFRQIWSKVHQATVEIIDNVMFDELVAKTVSNQYVEMYSI